MTDADKTRIEIEKEAQKIARLNSTSDDPMRFNALYNGYIAGATVWAERLKQERNKAIDECVQWITSCFMQANPCDRKTLINKLESLKSKPE